MADTRLSLALSGAPFPPEGRIAVFGPGADTDLTALPIDRLQIVQGFYPDHAAWAARGFDTVTDPAGAFSAAVIVTPRSKELARGWVHSALHLTSGGPVLLDGAKTDGIDSLLKDIRKRGEVLDVTSKAHGKAVLFRAAPAAIDDWALAEPAPGPEGFVTCPGIFSAAAVDKGSAVLTAALPPLTGRVGDLGAGWGYLSANALAASDAITSLDLVEADHAALRCARANLPDTRARFHWADVTRFRPAEPFDCVITNPPFHNSRAADPRLGIAFLSAAARMLRPGGTLWVVANRHLPYERTLAQLFTSVEEAAGNSGFKVIKASGPLKTAHRGQS